ncbi:hypothetical protein DPMN_107556 [Dreissena polymorpha]|uniref:Uncharacterized protein n=1 Tax=Dreissena polymorpha TaxID=45954 RepID=A0A9D4K7E6_DREPO|nr:hypothetical protein DPMN_107556 [Dreissena polymorpha]
MVGIRGTYTKPFKRILRYIDDEWVCTFKDPLRKNKSYPPQQPIASISPVGCVSG